MLAELFPVNNLLQPEVLSLSNVLFTIVILELSAFPSANLWS